MCTWCGLQDPTSAENSNGRTFSLHIFLPCEKFFWPKNAFESNGKMFRQQREDGTVTIYVKKTAIEMCSSGHTVLSRAAYFQRFLAFVAVVVVWDEFSLISK